VTACAGDAKPTSAAAAASRTNLNVDFTIKPFQSAAAGASINVWRLTFSFDAFSSRKPVPTMLENALIKTLDLRFQSAKTRSHRTIDDNPGIGRIGSRR
jgi:hypothetical protein